MSPVRSQDTTGFCYSFDSVQVLQQLSCKQRHLTSCPNDLSVLDAIQMGNGNGERGLIGGGFPKDSLEKISANSRAKFGRASLSEESCASFAKIGLWVSHVVVLTGYGDICCDGKCERQYKVQDSGMIFSQRYRGDEFWDSESDLIESMQRKQENSYAKTSTNLTWVEAI